MYLGKSCDEHVESCIVGEGKSDKNLVEVEIEKKTGKHKYFCHISKCNPPDVSLMLVSSDETKADPKTFFGEMPKTCQWLEQDGRTEGCTACIQPKLHGRVHNKSLWESSLGLAEATKNMPKSLKCCRVINLRCFSLANAKCWARVASSCRSSATFAVAEH